MAKLYTITTLAESYKYQTLVEQFLRESAHLSANTLRAYASDLRMFGDYLELELGEDVERVTWAQVTSSLVSSYRDWSSEISASQTTARRLASVKALASFIAAQFGVRNVAEGVKTPRVYKLQFKSLSDFQVERARAVAAKSSVRDQFIFELLLGTGLRCSEATQLTIGQLSLDWQWLLDVRGKGKKLRDVKLSKHMRDALLRYWQERQRYNTRPEYPLLYSDYGSRQRSPETYRVGVKTVWRVINGILLEAGIDERLCHPHTLRHTFARRFLRQLSEKTQDPARALVLLKEALGHSSIEITMLYLTTSKDEMAEAMEGIK